MVVMVVAVVVGVAATDELDKPNILWITGEGMSQWWAIPDMSNSPSGRHGAAFVIGALAA
ncbi:MAG: hypothetical protein AAFO89_06710 [Planctomycetota bacterium]